MASLKHAKYRKYQIAVVKRIVAEDHSCLYRAGRIGLKN